MKRSSIFFALFVVLFGSISPLQAGRYYIPKISRWATPDPALRQTLPQQLLRIHQGKLLSTSPYSYTFNNPLKYTDPNGKTPWDILDWAAFAYSAYELYKQPSWENAGWALADLGGALLPIVPSSGLVRHGGKLISRADLLRLNRAAGNIGEAIVERQLREAGEAFATQVVRGDAVLDFVTGSGKVIEVKNIDWAAPSYQKGGAVTGLINKIGEQLRKYSGVLQEGEKLILKITKPQDAKTIKQLEEMAKRRNATIEWLE